MAQSIPASQEDSPAPLRAYAVLVMGLIAVSMAAIFIRLALAEGVPALVIADARLIIATVILTPITLRRYRTHLQTLSRSDLLLLLISGLFLAIHFGSWVSSLQYANVLISGVIVTTTPIWAGLLEVTFLKTKLNRYIVLGLCVALIGGTIIAFSGQGAPTDAALVDESAANASTLTGAGLALIGAITLSVYMVIGRKVRATLPLLPYIWMVYGIAAITLLVVVLFSGLPVTGYSADGYLWMLALGLIPQLIGHSSLNYVLGYLPATLVSIATQLEPVASAAMAFILLRERPTELQLFGSFVILVGVTLTLLRPPQKSVPI